MTIAANRAGILRTFLHAKIRAIVAIAKTVARNEIVLRWLATPIARAAMPSVGVPILRPRKSAMRPLVTRIAIPVEKPFVTTLGINRTAAPRRVAAKKMRISPASMVHRDRPSIPFLLTMLDATAMKMTLGAQMRTFDSPKAEAKKVAAAAQ